MNSNENIAYQTQSTGSTKGKATASHVYILKRKIKTDELSF